MPLQSAHVFASHIGHTGKTTLCFQMSCVYAQKNPNSLVLVMDFAEEGDLTKRMMGGVDEASQKVQELFGGVFNLLADADTKSSGLTSWLWSRTIDLEQHAVQISKHNSNIPPNLFLISSGAWPRTEKDIALAERQRIVQKIRESMEKSPHTWKLFCDTDGDRRPSMFTKIAYGLCREAIVPLHLSKSDLDRTETMLGVMNELREAGEIQTQVLLIVWNFVTSQNNNPHEYKGMTFPFTPSKVNLDILDACNARVCGIRKDLPGLFVHEGASDADFVRSSTTILRHLADTVQKSAEELGKPFVQMAAELGSKTQLKLQSGGIEYTTSKDVIKGATDGLDSVITKFEAMAISSD